MSQDNCAFIFMFLTKMTNFPKLPLFEKKIMQSKGIEM